MYFIYKIYQKKLYKSKTQKDIIQERTTIKTRRLEA